MANQQRSPVGYRPFKTDPILEDSLLSVPRNDGGEFERRVAAGFQRMGAQFGERADRAAQTLGELEGKRDAIEGAPGAEEEFRPTRRDSIRGRAYDKAGTQIYLEQLDQTMINEQKAAYEKYGQSPGKLKEALGALLNDHMQKHVFEEIAPEYQLAFSKRATKLVDAAQKAAEARARAAAARAAAASRAQYIKAQQDNLIDLQRQAMNMGADPDGESAINDQLDLIRTDLQAAAASGRITQKQAEKLSEGAALTVARGTIQAKFDAAETADDKAAFAEDLKKAWLADDEKLGIYRDMPFEDIEKVSNSLASDARAMASEQRKQDAIVRARMQDLMDDDVASIEATGQGLSYEDVGLSAESVVQQFDEVKLAEWKEKQDVAKRTYGATAGMEGETAEEIAARVDALEPVPGSTGFADQEKIFGAALRKQDAIMKARAADPVKAMEDAYPDLGEMTQDLDWNDPAAVQSVVKQRYVAQQAVGLPPLSRYPLTMKEAYTLMEPALKQPDQAKQYRAVMDTVRSVRDTFGPYAEDVVGQMLKLRAVDNELARLGGGYLSKLSRDEPVPAGDVRQIETVSEAAAADRAFAPQGGDDTGWPIPNYEQQLMLVEQPELAPMFDRKFGQGAAARVIGRRSAEPPGVYDVPQGTVTIAPDGSESFVPNGEYVRRYTPIKSDANELTDSELRWRARGRDMMRNEAERMRER